MTGRSLLKPTLSPLDSCQLTDAFQHQRLREQQFLRSSVAEEHRQANKNVYYSLAFFCSGKALNVLRQSPDGHGAEVYRLLLHRFDRRDIQSASGLLQMILGFTMGTDLAQVKDKLAEFGALVGQVQRTEP